MKTAAGRRESTILPVQIDALRVPRAGVAQRRFSQAHGHAFAAAFDFGKLGYPVVNRVDGTNWLIDGQHRMYALRKQAGTKVWHLVVLRPRRPLWQNPLPACGKSRRFRLDQIDRVSYT